MVGNNFLKELFCFATNMVPIFQLCRIIMGLMENQHVMLGTKQMMITLEEKYILVSLIKLVKSLIIDLMR